MEQGTKSLLRLSGIKQKGRSSPLRPTRGEAPLIALIRLYQRFLSPVLGQNCRFYPTCSNYAVESLAQWGIVRGGWLAIRRIARCAPWSAGGVDPVPHNPDKSGQL